MVKINQDIFNGMFLIYEIVGKERKKDFIFWLEDICALINYGSDKNLKDNVLFKEFEENKDYIILEDFPSELISLKKKAKLNSLNSSNSRGRPKQHIFINYDCLKMLFLLVNKTSKIYGKYLTELQDNYSNLYTVFSYYKNTCKLIKNIYLYF